MVGVGIDGKESALARVSLVNYFGAVQLDEFVRQRERVIDYRTEWSGVRETDMINGELPVTSFVVRLSCILAKPFIEIQQQVADLLKDRILVGHAVFNDLKVSIYHTEICSSLMATVGIIALPPRAGNAGYPAICIQI